jgi:2-polyprenyl-3-methyl-5-hydroxy-6-metoxy-1,4-benzoquinol methylase
MSEHTRQGPPLVGDAVHPAYANPRPEVTRMIPARATKVLDVGCSVGVMGAALLAKGHEVTGLEYDADLAAQAATRLPVVHQGDVEAMAQGGEPIPGGPFDCVVFADVLEHLRDPWTVARWGATQVAPGGCMVVSVPNVRHVETVTSVILRSRWPYKAVGIFDRTHLRWFARKNLPDLLEGTDLEIVELGRNRMVHLDPRSRWNRLAPVLGDFGTLQFIFRAERPASR